MKDRFRPGHSQPILVQLRGAGGGGGVAIANEEKPTIPPKAIKTAERTIRIKLMHGF